MSRRKTAACKFIEAKTMVIPKPGKFPDVENKPIKSNTAGTDNIEDQKYQDKTAGVARRLGRAKARVGRLEAKMPEMPGADINPGGAEHMPNLTTPGIPAGPGRLGPNARPGPDGVMGTSDEPLGPQRPRFDTNLGPNARPGPDGVMGTPDDGTGEPIGMTAHWPPEGGFDPRLGPNAKPGPDGVMGTRDDGTGPEIGAFNKQNSANNLMRQAIKQSALNKNAIEDYGADKSLVLAQQPYLHPGVSRRDVSPEEEAIIAKKKKQWFPRIFESKGMPLTDRLSSPGKGALMSGLGGGVVGALGGALAGGSLANTGRTLGAPLSAGTNTGALIGAGVGGIGLGGLSALMSYYGRKARNEGVLEDVRRFPEGSTLRDLQSDPVYQGQMQREADARASRMNTGGNAGLLAAILASR